jgi:hypothetical protein
MKSKRIKVKWPKAARGCDIPIYGGQICLVSRPEDFIAMRHWAELPVDKQMPNGGVTCCIQMQDKVSGLFTGRPIYLMGVFDGSEVTLAHELIHVCFGVADDVGLTTDPGKANEAFAYLHSALMEKLRKYLKKPK